MSKISLLQTIDQLVEHGFCVGCGLCVAVCPKGDSRMVWNRYGALEPVLDQDHCTDCNLCAQVCPFADGVIEGVSNPTEDELGREWFQDSGSVYDPHLGFINGCQVGYAEEFRLNSTSGGIASWTLDRLHKTLRVDRVICVIPGSSPGPHFEYRVLADTQEVRAGARSRYYPVHLAEAIKIVLEEDARYALVGIPCVIKGVRLAQRQDERLRKRIVFTVGIFCGGLKTAFFTEYLAAQIGIDKDEIKNPEYRLKREGQGSTSYAFGAADPQDPTRLREFGVKRLKDLWGPGFFKPNVCDYCDDVVGETADLSAGDAWISPYTSDWRGTNIVITRSSLAKEVLAEGTSSGELKLEPLVPRKVVISQKGNFDHRRTGLAYRLYWAGSRPVPRKRVQPGRPPNLFQSMIYKYKMIVRANSHQAWLAQRDLPGTNIFDHQMRRSITLLRAWQYLERKTKKIFKR